MTARSSSAHTVHRIAATFTTLAAAAALGACALGPDYSRPEAPLPAAFHNAPAAEARGAAPTAWRATPSAVRRITIEVAIRIAMPR